MTATNAGSAPYAPVQSLRIPTNSTEEIEGRTPTEEGLRATLAHDAERQFPHRADLLQLMIFRVSPERAGSGHSRLKLESRRNANRGEVREKGAVIRQLPADRRPASPVA